MSGPRVSNPHFGPGDRPRPVVSLGDVSSSIGDMVAIITEDMVEQLKKAMTRLHNPHLEPGEEPRKETHNGPVAATSLPDAGEPETCDECGERTGRLSVEHPAHDAVFCSHSCKSTWTNKLHGSLR